MKPLFKPEKKRWLLINVIFVITAVSIEQVGISVNMYAYTDSFFYVLDVPLLIITYWLVIGHTSWVVYKRFGWIAGLVTGVIIDLPFELFAHQLGWWTWIPGWGPPIFFNAPIVNFIVYLSVSGGSILTYKYLMPPQT